MRRLTNGEQVVVGDIIKITHRFLNIIKDYKVYRVTPKYCFVKYSDLADGKFPRKVDMWFELLPRNKWKENEYEVWREE